MSNTYCPFFKENGQNMTCRGMICAIYTNGGCALKSIAVNLQKLAQSK